MAARTLDLFAGEARGSVIDPSSSTTRLNPQILQSRTVTIDPSTLTAIQSTLSTSRQKNETPGLILHLPLFDDADYFVAIHQYIQDGTGGASLTGVLQGIPCSQVSLEIQNGTLQGDVFLPGKIFQIRPSIKNNYIVSRIDQSKFPIEHDPIPIRPLASQGLKSQNIKPNPAQIGSTSDDGTRVDVLVVYDQGAADKAGGDGAVQVYIKNLVNETNLGYENSQVNLRIFLAGASLINYDETGFDWSKALSQLVDPADGHLDEVPALRDAASADLTVFLVGHYDDYCGISHHMTELSADFAPYAYAVVSYDCASANFSFAHELGHLMGSQHDRPNKGIETGVFSYSYGYQDPQGNFRTIMAEPGGCLTCLRINYWSNPSVTYQNLPTGIDPTAVDAADNAKSLDDAAPVVANFRDGPPPAAPPNLTASIDRSMPLAPVVNLAWSDNSPDETRFDVERSPRSQDQWTLVGNTAADISTYTDGTANVNTLYDYRVRSHSGNGDSVYTNIAPASTFLAPAKPAHLTAAQIDYNHANLTWNPLPDNSPSNGKADSVTIERSQDEGNNWIVLASQDAVITSYIDAQVLCDGSYTYRLKAINTGGASPYSDTVSLTIACPKPLTPDSLTANAVFPDKIGLSWSACQYATSYVIERSPGNSGVWSELITIPSSQTAYMDDHLKPGADFSYRIKAVNKTGRSDYSPVASALIPYRVWAPVIVVPR